jgi:hypothetical protein
MSTPSPLLAIPLVLACGSLGAQDIVYPPSSQPPPSQPVYKCDGRTYTHVPCTGGQPLGSRRVSATYGAAPPPQDRAKLMNRAQLSPEVRSQCETLEAAIRREEARLRAKGDPTESEKGDLAIQRVNYRDMRC